MKSASCEARKTADAATSSGVPHRASAVSARMRFSISGSQTPSQPSLVRPRYARRIITMASCEHHSSGRSSIHE